MIRGVENNKQTRNAKMANIIQMSSIVRMMLEGEQPYALLDFS